MSVKDILIQKSKINNTNQNQQNGDSSFDTYDYVYLESKEEVDGRQLEELQTSATDYAVALGANIFKTKTNFGKSTCWHWLRSALSSIRIEVVIQYGPSFGYSYGDVKDVGVCPALQFNLPSSFFAPSAFGNIGEFRFKINNVKSGFLTIYHTIEFDSLVYPQTKVKNELGEVLERAFTSGHLKKTGKSYQGRLTNSGYERNDEYYYQGNRYVRVKVFMENDDSKFEDGSTCISGEYMWFEVQPIKWIIRNWDELPTQINPKGNGTATSIKVRSQEALFSGVKFYQNMKDQNCSMWQNSTLRGALNGINVNNIRENGNLSFTAPNGGDFVGKSFIDDIIEEDYVDIEEVEKAKKEVDDVFFKAIKDAGFEHLL